MMEGGAEETQQIKNANNNTNIMTYLHATNAPKMPKMLRSKTTNKPSNKK